MLYLIIEFLFVKLLSLSCYEIILFQINLFYGFHQSSSPQEKTDE